MPSYKYPVPGAERRESNMDYHQVLEVVTFCLEKTLVNRYITNIKKYIIDPEIPQKERGRQVQDDEFVILSEGIL